MMKKTFACLVGMACLWTCQSVAAVSLSDTAVLKPRLVVLTDIAPAHIEPDDMESMIRLLAHADLFEIEALITTSGWNSSGGLYQQGWADSLQTVIDAYECDLPNLMRRSGQTDFLSLEREEEKQVLAQCRISAEPLHDGLSGVGGCCFGSRQPFGGQ